MSTKCLRILVSVVTVASLGWLSTVERLEGAKLRTVPPVPDTTVRVSVASDGTQGDFDSSNPALSTDGTVVAFVSNATNLVPNDTNNSVDIFVRDRATN